MEDKKLTFKIKNENGLDIECEELYSFKNEELGKNYMVYTDNSYDDEGNLCIYAAIYNPIDEEKKLIPIEDDNEWAFVEEMIDTLQEGENE